MMKHILTVLLALALCVGIASAEQAEQNSILGKPFPDFTVTDSEGNTFTLSEALKNHEAVLINLWATWCEPCKDEFPIMNKIYADYKDKVAFIALSKDNKKDTLEKIEEFRKERGLNFSMGRDEDQKLLKYIDSSSESIPKTVIVDRFGNAVFYQAGSFNGLGELRAVLDALLGDGYKETTVLTKIPEDTSTQAPEGKKAYIIHVVDQNNNPVKEVTVNFCTDTACTPRETDETGTITYESEPYKYHVQIIDVPDGYSYDESFDMYTTTEYGEWVIRVKKD